MKPMLRSQVPQSLDVLINGFGVPAYRASQLLQWLFQHGAMDWQQMSNIPASLRSELAEGYDLSGLTPVERQESTDGTRKFLFQLRDQHTIESVIIPTGDHPTFCLSTQVGCAMACRFCATARGGLVRNLVAGEIIEQVLRLEQDLADAPLADMGNRKPNIVFMGMGEPLDNWPAVRDSLAIMRSDKGLGISSRRIQISTSGPLQGMEQMVSESTVVGLTLCLGGSDDQERKQVMPVPGRSPLAQVVDLAALYAKKTGRRATLAWVLISGSTDRPEQAERQVGLAHRGNFKVNLIPLNPLDDLDWDRPNQQSTLAFQSILNESGVDTFIRLSGGRDIAAACGQLRRRRQNGKKKPGQS